MKFRDTSVVLVLLLIFAAPAFAATITLQSNAANLGAEVPSYDPRLTSGDISGLAFIPVSTVDTGSYTSIPPTAPSGTIQVHIPPDCGYWCGLSGMVEVTFTLPSGYSSPSLTGVGNVDDWGYAFLNGNAVGPQLNEFGNVAFGTTDPAFFQSGINTFVISDSNNSGPGAVAFYAYVNYSATPEPSSLLLLGSGLIGAVGVLRRRINL